MLCYNFLPAGSVSPVLTGILIFICCVIGGFLAYVTQKFAEDYSMPLLSAWGCMIVALLLVKAIGIRSGVVVLLVTILGAIGGGYIG